jgi:hypothetical protein
MKTNDAVREKVTRVMEIRTNSDLSQDLSVTEQSGLIHPVFVLPFIFALLFLHRVQRAHLFLSVIFLQASISPRPGKSVLWGDIYWEGTFGRKRWMSIKSFLVAGGGMAVEIHPIIWYGVGRIQFQPLVHEQIVRLGIDMREFQRSR